MKRKLFTDPLYGILRQERNYMRDEKIWKSLWLYSMGMRKHKRDFRQWINTRYQSNWYNSHGTLFHGTISTYSRKFFFWVKFAKCGLERRKQEAKKDKDWINTKKCCILNIILMHNSECCKFWNNISQYLQRNFNFVRLKVKFVKAFFFSIVASHIGILPQNWKSDWIYWSSGNISFIPQNIFMISRMKSHLFPIIQIWSYSYICRFHL